MRLVLVLLVAGCGGAPDILRAPITNGVPDDGDPAVVAILAPDGSLWCSGTLIAPHTVLTAAHCMVGPAETIGYRVLFGSSLAATAFADVSDGLPDPAFDAISFAHDVALLTLRQPGPAAPLPLDARTLDATLVGQSFQAVGFGRTAPSAGDQGQKRTGTAQVTAVGALDFTSVPAPSQPCTFDSGGAALFTVAGTTSVTGVISHGDTACADHAVYARVDATQSFIQGYLDATATGTVDTGARCLYDEQCSGGPCLQTTDEPAQWFCSRACRRDAECPSPMTCAADGCRFPIPSPGALGASCAQPDACAGGGICNAGLCTRRCVPVGNSCPEGFQCANAGGVDFYCVAVPRSQGCAAAPGAPSSPSAWVPLALLGVVLRRRSTWTAREAWRARGTWRARGPARRTG